MNGTAKAGIVVAIVSIGVVLIAFLINYSAYQDMGNRMSTLFGGGPPPIVVATYIGMLVGGVGFLVGVIIAVVGASKK